MACEHVGACVECLQQELRVVRKANSELRIALGEVAGALQTAQDERSASKRALGTPEAVRDAPAPSKVVVRKSKRVPKRKRRVEAKPAQAVWQHVDPVVVPPFVPAPLPERKNRVRVKPGALMNTLQIEQATGRPAHLLQMDLKQGKIPSTKNEQGRYLVRYEDVQKFKAQLREKGG